MSDIQTRTMEKAFYLQTKAFLEKNSEHINEIVRLKAEVERLRIAGNESEPRFVLLSDYQHLKAERDNFKTEVERLTKAGDAFISVGVKMREMIGDHHWTLEFDRVRTDWSHAAKEGKQS